LPVEDGVNRVILRSTAIAGKIEVRAEAKGLQAASIELASQPVSIQDGLSSVMPDEGLSGNLDRGPTPPGPSFQRKRIAIDVASIAAGSHTDTARQSMDDDDSTSWSSEGKLENAWIEYVFAQPETPRQIDLKLGGFRQTHYPLRVTLDGKTVWEGLTPTSLGYITLPLQSATGP